MLVRVLCLIIGYAFGLIQTSYIIGRLHGIDIREHGSGNAGTTNAMRTLGRKAGAMTLVGDMLKCLVAAQVVRLLFGGAYPDIRPLLCAYAAAGAILGHNFPFYMKFKGGKGIACTVGLVFSLSWQVGLVVMVEFLLIFFITHYVSLGSTLGYLLFLIQTIIFGQMGGFGMSQPHLLELYLVLFLLTVMALYRHRENIKRLLAGTESKIYLSKKQHKTLSIQGKTKPGRICLGIKNRTSRFCCFFSI